MIITLLIVALLDLALARPYAENECPNSSVSPADHKSLFKRINSGCPMSGPASCSGLDVSDTCCTEFPAGLILLTQDWKSNPTVGPSNSWTIHGLWLDNCDGSQTDNCDKERVYSNVPGLLTSQGASDTLNFMQTFWASVNQYSDGTFWEHEWSNHGTCFSTLKTPCLPNGSPQGAEAVAYFQTTVSLFQTLPTYSWLSNQGITPSQTQTYSLSAITDAIKAEWGFIPRLWCSRNTLVTMFYHFYLRGSAIDGIFVPVDAPVADSNCPSTGIKYPTKLGPLSSTTSTTSYATIKSSAGGGLIATGNWMMQPLPNFSLSGSISSFTLKSPKGICGVSNSMFSCGRSVTPSTFYAVPSGDKLLLAFGGSTWFSSDGVARSAKQQRVYTGNSQPVVYTLEIAPSSP